MRLVELGRNVGFAAAVNRGIEAAAGAEFVAVVNNDLELDPRWIQEMVAALTGTRARDRRRRRCSSTTAAT